MSTNLIIVSGDTVCFSNYIKKPNGLLTRIDLTCFVHHATGRFTIPIRLEGMMTLYGSRLDPIIKDDTGVKDGPIFICIHDESCTEHYVDKSFNITSIPVFGDSFYCRSNNYEAESAATAGSFIYNHSDYIYKETFKAIGETPPPFYKGKISSISKASKILMDLEKSIVLVEKSTNKKDKTEYDRILNEYKRINKDLETFFELKRFT